MEKKGHQCLVCVGSTEFDTLIKEIDNELFEYMLVKNGFTNLVVQSGKGTYKLRYLSDSKKLEVKADGFMVLEPIINQSELVISHCGAGVLLECLRSTNEGLGTTNVAVINSTLMNNHQMELGSKLHKEGFNHTTTTHKILADLDEIFRKGKFGHFKKFPPVKPGVIVDLMDDVLLS